MYRETARPTRDAICDQRHRAQIQLAICTGADRGDIPGGQQGHGYADRRPAQCGILGEESVSVGVVRRSCLISRLYMQLVEICRSGEVGCQLTRISKTAQGMPLLVAWVRG